MPHLTGLAAYGEKRLKRENWTLHAFSNFKIIKMKLKALHGLKEEIILDSSWQPVAEIKRFTYMKQRVRKCFRMRMPIKNSSFQ